MAYPYKWRMDSISRTFGTTNHFLFSRSMTRVYTGRRFRRIKDSRGKMKATGTIECGTGLCQAPNEGANSSSGFTGLPGDNRHSIAGEFNALNRVGFWWGSSFYSPTISTACFLFWQGTDMDRAGSFENNFGLSVRCIKDWQPYMHLNKTGW